MPPAIAQKLGITAEQTDQYLPSNFPAFTTLLDRWKSGMGNSAHARSLQQVQFIDEFRNADATPYERCPTS